MGDLTWVQLGFFEAGGGDRVALLKLDDGHWAVCWAYAAPQSNVQLVSLAPEQAEEIFLASRKRYEANEGLTADSWYRSR
ncbi:hypothetical protein [Streptomyces sp. NPDC005148]